MTDPRHLRQLAETRYRREHLGDNQHLQPATQTRCPGSHYVSEVRGGGVQVRCATAAGGSGCGFLCWWPSAELERAW